MFITQHAYDRMLSRLGATRAAELRGELERLMGEPGTVAYLVGTYVEPFRADDGSNGDTIVAVAVDGSVETVFFRRSSQDMSAEFFGARKVVML